MVRRWAEVPGSVVAPALAAPTRRAGFADPLVGDRLARDGYVVLPGRLPSDAIEALADLYARAIAAVGADTSGRFLPSMMIGRRDLRAQLWDGVRRIAAPHIEPASEPGALEVFGGSFVSKPSSQHSSRGPHQDPTVFDEEAELSLSIWIPLSDSHASNGTLHVLAGSHRMANHVRPPDVESFDDEVRQVALRDSIPLELGAGEMVVIDGEVIHHSPPNESGRERVSAICAVRRPGVPMRMVRSEGGAEAGLADVYEVDDEAYRSGDLIDPDLRAARQLGRASYAPASLADLHRSLAAASS